MSLKRQIIRIELSEDQTKKYFEAASRKISSEVDEDCLPSGVTLEITVGLPFGEFASVEGKDLGPVSFEIVELD